jgi:beta-lactamase class A
MFKLMYGTAGLLVIFGASLLLSMPVAADDFPVLSATRDAAMQRAMEARLEKLGLARAVAEQRLAVSLVDITDLKNPRMADVNGDVMLYAASLPKIAILLGALQRVHDGTLTLDDDLQDKLVRMIRHSSNAAASEVLDLVDEEYLAALLQSDDYQFYKSGRGGLWVGKSYDKSPAWKRDPVFNISHGATAREVSRFYYLLATDRLVSAQSCSIMREVLSEPAINHKFVSGIRAGHPDANIYRKSGTWRTYHSDSAIIEHDGGQYIVVALANDPAAGKWLQEIVIEMDEIVIASSQAAAPAASAGAQHALLQTGGSTLR